MTDLTNSAGIILQIEILVRNVSEIQILPKVRKVISYSKIFSYLESNDLYRLRHFNVGNDLITTSN